MSVLSKGYDATIGYSNKESISGSSLGLMKHFYLWILIEGPYALS